MKLLHKTQDAQWPLFIDGAAVEFLSVESLKLKKEVEDLLKGLAQ